MSANISNGIILIVLASKMFFNCLFVTFFFFIYVQKIGKEINKFELLKKSPGGITQLVVSLGLIGKQRILRDHYSIP